MSQFQGFAAHAAGAELLPYKYDPGDLGAHEVEVAITHCGVCHSDLHLIANDWGVSQYPFIPGHEIIGAVEAVGSEVRSLTVGQRVGIGWQSNSCGHCEWCVKGMENLCPAAESTCVHRHGGYADRVRANDRFVIPIPEALESESAAPLLCAGVTVYNPLRNLGVNPSTRIGVVGIGGLGHLALQFAKVFGADVTAFSSSAAKEEEALELGAHRFVNTRETKAMKNIGSSLDIIISTLNADPDWNTYVGALRPNGTVCLLGIPAKNLTVNAFSLIGSQRCITGSPVGSPSRLREMLDVAARHGVRAKVESFPMAKANEAVDRVKKNKVRYRAVLSN